MAAKSVVLEGYGQIMISPIAIKEKSMETVDPSGNPVKREMVGEGRKTVYKTQDGTEIPSSQLCKKIIIEDEEIIAPKFTMSKEIARDNIEEIEDNGLIYTALDRKFYSVVTDNETLKDLVMNQNKTLSYPFTAGQGWKMWRGVLTNWSGKMIMVCCRGDLTKEIEKYSDDTVSFEIELVPQQQNMKKLVKAMAMV